MLPGILGAVLSLSLFAQTDARSQIRGHVVDTGGGAIAAIIRVVRPDTKAVVLRFRAEETGMFEAVGLAPGLYSVTAYAPGFRRRELSRIIVEGGSVADLGAVTLEISGCDTPGTSCTYVGVPEDVKRTTTQSYVTMKLGCAVDLESKGDSICPERKDSDVSLVHKNGKLSLVAVNGAGFSAPYPSSRTCDDVSFETNDIAVVGLGLGVDFCVRTKRGSVSHVFFTDDIESENTSQVKLWYVTRKGR